MVNHTLTEKNFETRSAVCSIDGPVSLRSRGRGRWECAVKKAEKKRAYLERHPEKARASRRSRSAHRLTSFDASTMTGECPLCGTVGAVVKGRRRKDGTPGVMCANRAKELWPAGLDETPQDFCTTCRRAYLDAAGECPRCTDEAHADLNLGLAVMRQHGREAMEADDWFDGELYVTTTDDETPRHENAVPGWKTLGAGSANRWWAENAHLVEGD